MIPISCYTPTSLWKQLMLMKKPKILRIDKTIGKECITIQEEQK